MSVYTTIRPRIYYACIGRYMSGISYPLVVSYTSRAFTGASAKY